MALFLFFQSSNKFLVALDLHFFMYQKAFQLSYHCKRNMKRDGVAERGTKGKEAMVLFFFFSLFFLLLKKKKKRKEYQCIEKDQNSQMAEDDDDVSQ